MQETFLSFNIFIMLFNICLHFVIYPRGLSIVKNFGFMGNEMFLDILNSFIKNQYFSITPLLQKTPS